MPRDEAWFVSSSVQPKVQEDRVAGNVFDNVWHQDEQLGARAVIGGSGFGPQVSEMITPKEAEHLGMVNADSAVGRLREEFLLQGGEAHGTAQIGPATIEKATPVDTAITTTGDLQVGKTVIPAGSRLYEAQLGGNRFTRLELPNHGPVITNSLIDGKPTWNARMGNMIDSPDVLWRTGEDGLNYYSPVRGMLTGHGDVEHIGRLTQRFPGLASSGRLTELLSRTKPFFELPSLDDVLLAAKRAGTFAAERMC